MIFSAKTSICSSVENCSFYKIGNTLNAKPTRLYFAIFSDD